MHVLPMSTTRPWVITDKNHTQKKIEKNFSTDVDVSDYGESKSAIKTNLQKKKLRPRSGRETFIYHTYMVHIYVYI
jgi:hypothetical protein